MVSSTNAPVSIARIVRQSSNHTSESEGTAGRASSSTTRPILRHGHPSSGGSEEASSDGLKESRQSFSQYSQPSSDGHIASPHRFASDDDRADSDSSEEDVTSDGHGGASSRYGRQIRHSPGAYSMVPPSTRDSVHAAETPLSFSPDGNMHNFVDRFRVLLDEVSRETDAALEFARNDRPGLYIDPTASSSPTSLDQISLPPSPDIDYVPIVGALIRRMPTIESLGSREVMSLASSIIRGDRSLLPLIDNRPHTNPVSEVETPSSHAEGYVGSKSTAPHPGINSSADKVQIVRSS
ncbi:hypothetical protein PHLCEN_2v11145 [Hermanssonia centrifuga]|uniref:Uncharacterized protein n=1 Tax=Hermanssonia centrifuga TaxID=98765 RepID=A0A2R6NL58_9APHY|nr:hypothetical protein PHLCEN_2v11145 [Hermanssonia centrifuga]